MLNIIDCDEYVIKLLDVTDVANYKKCNKKLNIIIDNMNIPMESFCYECQNKHSMDKMQLYPCDICKGRKCLDLHGSNIKCDVCDKNLCADCSSFGLCCKV